MRTNLGLKIGILIILLILFLPFYKSSQYYRSSDYSIEGWSEEVKITNYLGNTYCQNPQTVCSGNNLFLAWHKWDYVRATNNYILSNDGGNTWKDEQVFSQNGNIQDLISINDTIHILYYQSPETGIRYKCSNNFGDSWNSEVKISDYFGIADIAVDGTDIYVVNDYDVDTNYGWRIYFIRSSDNGKTWSAPKAIGSGNGENYKQTPKIATYKNYVHIAYWEENDTISYLRSKDKGTTWEEVRTIVSNNNSRSPMIAVNKNFVYLAWINVEYGRSLLSFKVSSDNGDTWSEMIFITDPEDTNIGVEDPNMVFENQKLYFTWADWRDCNVDPENTNGYIYTEIYFKFTANNGNSWSEDLRLTKKNPIGPYSSWSPKITVTNNSVYVVWQDTRDTGGDQIYYRRTIPNLFTQEIVVPENLISKKETNISYFIKNNGNADSYKIKFTLYDNKNYYTTRIIERIEKNDICNVTFQWTPSTSGSHELELFIDPEDKILETNEDDNNYKKEVSVKENQRPIAYLDTTKKISLVNETIIFNASNSSDSDGEIIAFFFDFGDGNNSGWVQESITSHEYSTPGQYKSTLKVKDDSGEENTNLAEIIMDVKSLNHPPIISNITADLNTVEPNGNLKISVEAFDIDDDDILLYFYNSSDGIIIGNNSIIYWRAPNYEGTFVISVKVFDGELYSEAKSIDISVKSIEYSPVIEKVIITPNFIYNDKSNEILVVVKIFDKNGLSDINSVYIDLSELSGKNRQRLYDDGYNGDEIKNDGNYSFKLSVKPNIPTGAKLLKIETTDNSGLKAYDNFTFQVKEPVSESNDISSSILVISLILIILIFIILFILFLKKIKAEPKKQKTKSKSKIEAQLLNKENLFKCPNCKKEFEVQNLKKSKFQKCPHCGVRGKIG